MSFPILLFLALAVLVIGMGVVFCELRRLDKEREATAQMVMTLLLNNSPVGKMTIQRAQYTKPLTCREAYSTLVNTGFRANE